MDVQIINITKTSIPKLFQGPPKYSQIGIFGMQIHSLATRQSLK
jgi:hypothetical protein